MARVCLISVSCASEQRKVSHALPAQQTTKEIARMSRSFLCLRGSEKKRGGRQRRIAAFCDVWLSWHSKSGKAPRMRWTCCVVLKWSWLRTAPYLYFLVSLFVSPSMQLGWLCFCQAVHLNQMSMVFRTMRTAVVSDAVSLLGKLGYTQKLVWMSIWLLRMRWKCQERTSGGLWLVVCGRVLGKKPEVDGVLHHEACPKLAVKFHLLTVTFDLLQHVFFSRRQLVNSKQEKEQRNRKAVFFWGRFNFTRKEDIATKVTAHARRDR